MYRFNITSPIGKLTAEVEGGAVVSLSLHGEPETEQTPTPAEIAVAERLRVELGEYFAGERTAFDLPLAPRGTEFQESVWREMQKIPYGKTVTYGDLAKAIGKPKAARAVGGVCNRNRILILIPCHRVVGASGIGGFEFGTETKERLLDIERAK